MVQSMEYDNKLNTAKHNINKINIGETHEDNR